jgi:hypothetical protein
MLYTIGYTYHLTLSRLKRASNSLSVLLQHNRRRRQLLGPKPAVGHPTHRLPTAARRTSSTWSSRQHDRPQHL